MLIPFRPIELSDRQWVEELHSYSDYRGAEYSFSNNYNWSRIYKFTIARVDDFMFYLTGLGGSGSYLYPAGRGDFDEAIRLLMKDAHRRGIPFRMHGIQAHQVEELKSSFPGKFVFKKSDDYNDYIYLVEKMQTLSGKKLHAKRNHINRFKERYPDWQYEEITQDNIEDARKMSVKWCKINNCESSESLASEACVVRSALKNFEALGLRGGLIRADGRVVAFTLGRPINSDTFGVTIEKAFSEVQGAYPMINQQFAIHSMNGFTYVNREDDTGDEGLRRAKRSYYPAFMYERYSAQYAQEQH